MRGLSSVQVTFDISGEECCATWVSWENALQRRKNVVRGSWLCLARTSSDDLLLSLDAARRGGLVARDHVETGQPRAADATLKTADSMHRAHVSNHVRGSREDLGASLNTAGECAASGAALILVARGRRGDFVVHARRSALFAYVPSKSHYRVDMRV